MSGGDVVHVAVGKSMEKTLALLQWTFSMFPVHEFVLLHVHRLSPCIPTPLGKLPATRANPELLAAFRHEEREETMKLLSTYLMICSRSMQVKTSIITTETDEVQKEIVDLVNLHTITKLVVEANPDFMRRASCEASYVAKHTPSYCEMWFVNKRKLIWARPTSATSTIRSKTTTEFLRNTCEPLYRHSVSSSETPRVSSVSNLKTVEECLCIELDELEREIDELKDEAFMKLHDPKIMEYEAMEAFNKVKALEMVNSHKEKLRIEAEDSLSITIRGQEVLLEEREKVSQQLQKTMRNIALIDTRTKEANRRCEEVAEELKLIEVSIPNLRNEKQRLHGKKNEATRWLDTWRNHETSQDEFIKWKEDSCEVLPELLLSDVESATSNFCESLQIGEGEYGTVYKGEMFGKTVAIKKLHAYDTQRHEFDTAVQVLGQLHHPNLVKLIGVCPESCSLIYEYLPGGSLQNYLHNKRNIGALNWKTRARIVADIASPLLFLHSFKSKKIVHGNLKPENLFLDSENRCRISDYGDNMLIPTRAFRRRSASGGLYPESYKSGTLTHKSDIYSFGVIILQLVTGKTKGRIVGKVRRALSSGKIATMFDLSAGEWSTYVAWRLVELGLHCCESKSRDRPELTVSLVRELERMPFLEEQNVPSFLLCPILRDIMHDPQLAADGFTYEGEAIRAWLGSGRETSPMTNLKLSHLDLTPNYSLKLVIQDWVANLNLDVDIQN